jgi:hypothetical protein
MRRGDHASAWAISDAVLATRANPPDDPRLPYHLRYVWDGSPIDGREVLVRCYHGLGDTLQFLRFLPALRARAASVALEVQPALVALLGRQGGIDRLIPFDPGAPAPPAACTLEIMELSHALRLPPEAATPPYLGATARHGRAWPNRETTTGAPASSPDMTIGNTERIAIRTQAGDWDAARSLPAGALEAALAGHRLVRLDPGDIVRTAVRIAEAKLVVSVDTMTAHLAGALGRPLRVLLKAEADWRWGDGEATPWYPSARLYRQRSQGDWSAPLADLADELSAPSPLACARAE